MAWKAYKIRLCNGLFGPKKISRDLNDEYGQRDDGVRVDFELGYGSITRVLTKEQIRSFFYSKKKTTSNEDNLDLIENYINEY